MTQHPTSSTSFLRPSDPRRYDPRLFVALLSSFPFISSSIPGATPPPPPLRDIVARPRYPPFPLVIPLPPVYPSHIYTMSNVWGWFGGGAAGQKKKDTPKNAILGLRSQLEMLQKREGHLQTQIDQQDAIARKNVTTNKNGKQIARKAERRERKNTPPHCLTILTRRFQPPKLRCGAERRTSTAWSRRRHRSARSSSRSMPSSPPTSTARRWPPWSGPRPP